MLRSGFANVPESRWLEEARRRYVVAETGLKINYDPELAHIFNGPSDGSATANPDLWSMFSALEGLPLALVRGVNSDILSAETAEEMQRHRPDMIYAKVPDRGHTPFLDEPEALDAIRTWLAKLA